MHRIEGDGFVVVGGKNMFTEGNPIIPTPATMVTADWANAAQEEIALTIEGLGGTLNTAATDTTPNQLLTRLNAKFGRLDLANTWASNQSIGGTLTVTGATTLNDPVTMEGPLTITAGSEAVMLKTTTDNAYIALYPRTATPLVRGGYFGVPAPGATEVVVVNEMTNGNIRLTPNGTGVVTVGANVRLTGSNPAGTTAFQNTLTPRNFTKASATIKVSGGVGIITVEDAFNVASVALNGTLLRITFAQAFASAAYQVTFGINDSWAGPMAIFWRAKAAGTLDIAASQMDGTAISFATVNAYFDVSVTGAQ